MPVERYGYEEIANKPVNNEGLKELFTKQRPMTEEQIKQKAEAEADKVIIGSGMDRTSVIHLKHMLVTMYIQGATETTKELEAQIEKMKCCYNCKHSRTDYVHCITDKHEKWEMIEK